MPGRKSIRFTERNVHHVTLGNPVNVSSFHRPYFFAGKLHLQSTPEAPLSRTRAQRVFLKPIRDTPDALRHAKNEMNVRERMRAAGIRVPKAGIVSGIMHGKPTFFLAVEPFLREGGKTSKLTPINENMAEPTFLRRLDVKKDRAAIEETAKRTAQLLNAGFVFDHLDMFGYYHSRRG